MEGVFSGSCHCGKVVFKIDGKVLNVLNCHCSICRKANGGAFSSYLVVPDEAFEVTRGSELLTHYAMTDKGEKTSATFVAPRFLIVINFMPESRLCLWDVSMMQQSSFQR